MFRNLKRRGSGYLRTDASTDPDQDDTHMYRCKVCNFICSSKRVRVDKGDPDRTTYKDGNSYTDEGNNFHSIDVAKDACPMCGTYYSKTPEE